MVEEHTQLTIRTGEENEFEREFEAVSHLVLESPGCLGVDLLRSVDQPGKYLLKIGWNKLTDHTEGFANGPIREEFSGPIRRYSAEKAIANHYDPTPVVHRAQAEGTQS